MRYAVSALFLFLGASGTYLFLSALGEIHDLQSANATELMASAFADMADPEAEARTQLLAELKVHYCLLIGASALWVAAGLVGMFRETLFRRIWWLPALTSLVLAAVGWNATPDPIALKGATNRFLTAVDVPFENAVVQALLGTIVALVTAIHIFRTRRKSSVS